MDGKLNQSSFTVKIQPSKDCLNVIIEVWNYFLIIHCYPLQYVVQIAIFHLFTLKYAHTEFA